MASSDPNVTEYNNYTQLCEIVASYYLVQSVTDDATSSLLRDLGNTATATLKFWASVM